MKPEDAGPEPKLCEGCHKLAASSNLEWVLCGGQTAGMEPATYVWQLRDKGELARVQQTTKDLQRLASAARLLTRLRTYVQWVDNDGEEDEERDELLSRIDKFFKR